MKIVGEITSNGETFHLVQMSREEIGKVETLLQSHDREILEMYELDEAYKIESGYWYWNEVLQCPVLTLYPATHNESAWFVMEPIFKNRSVPQMITRTVHTKTLAYKIDDRGIDY